MQRNEGQGAADPLGSSRLRTSALVALVVLGAAATLAGSWPRAIGMAFAFWAFACLAGEMLWLRLPLGRATLDMASCFNFAALLVLPRGEAMLAAAAATLVADLAFMRKPVQRAVFNSAQTVLSVAAAAWAFALLSGEPNGSAAMLAHFNLLPLLGAGFAYYAVNRVTVTLAVASCEGLSPLAAWRRNFGNSHDLISTGAVLSLGALVALQVSVRGVGVAVLVVLPLVVAFDAYRRFLGRSAPAADELAERHAA